MGTQNEIKKQEKKREIILNKVINAYIERGKEDLEDNLRYILLHYFGECSNYDLNEELKEVLR